ncbi:tripeptidyl-peptidase [Aureococcus anophagefferens]|nr:tripeptidyl-peptidase [Aureococcus anophagefferens]
MITLKSVRRGRRLRLRGRGRAPRLPARRVSVASAEELAGGEYYEFARTDGQTATRCVGCSLPENLRSAAAFVEPTSRFPNLRRKSAPARPGDGANAACAGILRDEYGLSGAYPSLTNRSEHYVVVTAFDGEFASPADAQKFYRDCAPDLASSGYAPTIEGPNRGNRPGAEANLDVQYAAVSGGVPLEPRVSRRRRRGQDFAIIYDREAVYVSGTSCSAPTFAGVVALLNDARLSAGKPKLGFLNPLIYKYRAAFDDVLLGNNGKCGTDGFRALEAGTRPYGGYAEAAIYRMIKDLGGSKKTKVKRRIEPPGTPIVADDALRHHQGRVDGPATPAQRRFGGGGRRAAAFLSLHFMPEKDQAPTMRLVFDELKPGGVFAGGVFGAGSSEPVADALRAIPERKAFKDCFPADFDYGACATRMTLSSVDAWRAALADDMEAYLRDVWGATAKPHFTGDDDKFAKFLNVVASEVKAVRELTEIKRDHIF